MLHAAVKHKINICTCEDSKTSTIIGNMLHLPSDIFWKILKNSCCDSDALPDAGEILDFYFWPNYNAKNKEISNSYTVEPDVIIRFENIDVIIEAKLKDTSGQYYNQWKNEVISFVDRFRSTKPIFLIALGGCNLNTNTEDISYKNLIIKVVKCKWFSLLTTITKERNLLSISNVDSQNNALLRIFADIIAGFNFHNEFYTEWLDSIDNKLLNINIQSIDVFKNF